MKPNLIHRISAILFSAILFLSCSSDLDFDQIDDFKIEPVFVANVAHFNVKANEIDDDGTAHQIPPDVEDFDVFKNKFLNDNLTKAELNFETENTFNRAFKVEITFIDANDQPMETITLNVPQYNGTANIIKYPTEVFEGERLALLKRTVKVGFVVTIEPGTGDISGNLKFKSGATAYMRIE
ncbi:hypothetical protein L1276_002423 [Flavobacterium sp. HSC-32F16]|uniref:hypothetical protein n=1 Tax=Flavobacterium sp. HSC-32F16 TaxID=2910964 RepID=UPI0020A3B895|nr:hypothetical protein [Flavobacterium sp. HSC-32F16]MCP2027266.1 hypothetical protein [Flavobacterium sp. HSC-32F16]